MSFAFTTSHPYRASLRVDVCAICMMSRREHATSEHDTIVRRAPGVHSDTRPRVLSLDTLRALCDAFSGVAHRYDVEMGVTRCIVTYSNPDEWGMERPIRMAFPTWRAQADRYTARDGFVVALTDPRVTGGRHADDRDCAVDALLCLLSTVRMEWDGDDAAMRPAFVPTGSAV